MTSQPRETIAIPTRELTSEELASAKHNYGLPPNATLAEVSAKRVQAAQEYIREALRLTEIGDLDKPVGAPMDIGISGWVALGVRNTVNTGRKATQFLKAEFQDNPEALRAVRNATFDEIARIFLRFGMT